MTTPDVPPAHEEIDVDVYAYRWPSGAEKVELIDGALLFYGEFDERDVVIAERTYPGRRVLLGPDGALEVYPGGSNWTILGRYGGGEAAVG